MKRERGKKCEKRNHSLTNERETKQRSQHEKEKKGKAAIATSGVHLAENDIVCHTRNLRQPPNNANKMQLKKKNERTKQL